MPMTGTVTGRAMRTHRNPLLAVLAPAFALVLWAAPAEARPPVPGAPPTAGNAACDPAVAEALARSAEAGVEADLAIIRHPEQGIRNPDSIFDFSCIWDLFDYRAFDVLFDPAGALDDVLDLARRRLCAVARDAYRRYLGRALDASVYTVPARRLPGLEPDWRRRNVIEDAGAPGGDSELFRGVVGGGR